MVIEAGASGLAEKVKVGVVENLVEPLVEGMAGRCGQLAAVPQVLLSLSHLPRAHRHSSIVRPKHFQGYMFLDFRHGLLAYTMRTDGHKKEIGPLGHFYVADPAWPKHIPIQE